MHAFAAACGGTALWSDDDHVEAMRARLRERKDMADRLLGAFPGYYRPPCGFFLWLKVDDGVALTQRLWRDFALKVLPGAYLTQPDGQGRNAGVEFVRIALVHDPETTRDGLSRLSEALGAARSAASVERRGGASRQAPEVGLNSRPKLSSRTTGLPFPRRTQMMKQLALAAAVLATFSGAAFAGKTLDTIKQRDQLVCGVNPGLPGFAAADSQGNWTGLDVDICRAIAATILQDPKKIKWVPLNASQRFTALQSGEVDILSRNTTWTLTRDASLGLEFTGVTYYDGQGFMVPKKSKVTSAKQLKGATVCVQSGRPPRRTSPIFRRRTTSR
jgi:hypothetical protein